MGSVQVSDTESRSGLAGRIERWVRKYRWFLMFVVLPVMVSILYYGFVASDIYVSEARFVVKSPDEKRSQSTTLASIIQTTGLSAGQEQTSEILEYVRSRDALRDLSKRLDMRAMYMRSQADWVSRYPSGMQEDNFENLYKYYSKMVAAKLDHDTGTAVLTVKGFTPKDAYEIDEGLLKLSEDLVNRLNVRAQKTQVAEAEGRVSEAEKRVRAARLVMRQYRNDERVLDPGKEAGGVLEVSTGLTARRAALMAQLQSMIATAPRNPAIPALRNQIAALDGQIGLQAGRAAGTSNGLASKLSEYENLQVEQDFATKMFTTAAASLEQARADAMQQQFYLERIVEPNVPDMALLPQRLFQILSVMGVALCLYLVGWMLIVGILEHRPEE